jgi:hypothetical protein
MRGRCAYVGLRSVFVNSSTPEQSEDRVSNLTIHVDASISSGYHQFDDNIVAMTGFRYCGPVEGILKPGVVPDAHPPIVGEHMLSTDHKDAYVMLFS